MSIKLTQSTQNKLLQAIALKGLPTNFMETILQWYLPLAELIAFNAKQLKKPYIMSFNGSQGSGKSTLTYFVALLLNEQFGLHTVEFSIDDLYLTKLQRMQLAKDIHPLFATRGVPGTHDIKLGMKLFEELSNCKESSPCKMPRFDKAKDDRSDESEWPTITKPVDVILFEGWCNHAPVESEVTLNASINSLELIEDKDAIWRHHVNDQLELYHQSLFKQCHQLVYLKAPSFDKVYEWRGLQEKKLADSHTTESNHVMNEKQLKRFIQHYERITKNCLATLPDTADIVYHINDAHEIVEMVTKADR